MGGAASSRVTCDPRDPVEECDVSDARASIAVLSTGGTIANTDGGRLPLSDVLADIRARPGGHDGLAPFALKLIEVCREGAASFSPSTWELVGRSAQEAVDDDDVDGVLVTHGTYSLEETAYYLHLTVATDKPVVVTCSQRRHGTIGNDGDRNLLDALRVVGHADARGAGVLVVANEEIHSAREVIKTSRRPDGFKSPALGPLGFVDEDQVSLYRAQRRRHTARSRFIEPPTGPMPRIEVLTSHPGAAVDLVTSAVKAGADGIVMQGYAYSGTPSSAQAAALRRAVDAGIPVVLVSRGREGRIPAEAHQTEFVRGDNLSVSKAHVLLLTAIRAGLKEPAELQQVFDEY